MSLPQMPRPAGGRPERSGSLPAPVPGLPSIPKPVENKDDTAVEILAIQVEQKTNDDTVLVTFDGHGFDLENDGIILDIIRLAANSYGYDITPIED